MSTHPKPTALAVKIANTLYEAGRRRASGMVRKNGPMISFAEWVDMLLAEHYRDPVTPPGKQGRSQEQRKK